MVNKIMAYKNSSGEIIEIDNRNIIDAYKTSDGGIFLSELDAYKHEVNCLSNSQTEKVFVSPQESFNKIEKVNDVPIPKNVKQYLLSELFANSCGFITESPGIYMWVNIYEKLPYCGSANNLRERVKNFVNSKNDFYAGKKINAIRKKYVDVHNLAWKLFILEENVKPDELLEKENFYIKKFNSITCGYNIMNPVKHKKEGDVKKYQIELAKNGYNGILKGIKNWGLTTNLSLEEYSDKYVVNEKYPSFRLTCFMNNKNVVEKNDLVSVPRRFIDLIDVGRSAFRNEKDTIPTSLIRHRVYDDVYLPLCNVEKTFKTAIDAVKYQVENYREKALNALMGEEYKTYYDFIKKSSIETFIDLMFFDSENLRTFLLKKECEKKNIKSVITKNSKKCYYETKSK
jgi:hypothetical protein